MDALRTAYEKTALHRMSIPLETAMARLPWLPWLREVLEGSARRSQPQPTARPARTAGAR